MGRPKKIQTDLSSEKISNKKLSMKEIISKIENEDFSFIKNRILFQDEVDLVKFMVDNCFNGFDYIPSYSSIAFGAGILIYFCNLKYENIDQISDFIYDDRGLFGLVLKHINMHQLNNIEKAYNFSTNFRKDQILKHINSLSDDVIGEISNLINNINEKANMVFDKIKDIKVENIEGFITNLFNNIDIKDITNIIKNIKK